MKVGDAMTREVRVASPDQTVREVARTMAELDTGVLPVGENDRLVGMITDRDIAVRGVAEGKGPDAPVREIMTPDVRYCFEDEDVRDVARTMAESQVRRLPVLNATSGSSASSRSGTSPSWRARTQPPQPCAASRSPPASARRPTVFAPEGQQRRAARAAPTRDMREVPRSGSLHAYGVRESGRG